MKKVYRFVHMLLAVTASVFTGCQAAAEQDRDEYPEILKHIDNLEDLARRL